MKKVLFFILFFCACLQTNAQQFYNEEGKFYEFACVWYHGLFHSPGLAYISSPTSHKWEQECADDSGKKIEFKNFMACINYFMAKGWTVINIAMDQDFRGSTSINNHFFIRREITKEQAEKLSQDCIKDLK